MLLQLGVPSFDTVVHNASCSFSHRLSLCCNRPVRLVCDFFCVYGCVVVQCFSLRFLLLFSIITFISILVIISSFCWALVLCQFFYILTSYLIRILITNAEWISIRNRSHLKL